MQPHTGRVFTPQQELSIVEYTIHAAKMFYGLPMNEVRRMVYQYAHAVGSQSIPDAWEKDKMATRDWYYSFMDRHPNLVLKAPEGMSIARIVAFNKVNVETFFNAYTLAMEKYQFTPDRIYNLDESSLSTVMRPVKVVCERGHPVASQVSRERGDTMTFVGIINAVGQSIPPVFIIPRVRWNPAFMWNTVFGAKGILHPNGWMNGDCFVKTLQHLHEKAQSSVDNKILLIMDNAECHMNIHVVEYAIQHGIVIVTLPPHTTDKLQPLDVSVFGPFKTFLRSLLNAHALMHPNQHITVHQLPAFASEAWTKATTPSNILGGFRATGIWPINRHIFPDEAFVGAQVTERPAPPETFSVEVASTLSDGEEEQPDIQSSEVNAPGPSSMPAFDTLANPAVDIEPGQDGDVGASSDPVTPARASATPAPAAAEPAQPAAEPAQPAAEPATPEVGQRLPGPSHPVTPASTTSASSVSPQVTPESVRPFPKAQPRPYGKGRKRVRACILTENEEAISDLRMKAEKKKKAEEKKRTTARKGKGPGKPKKTAIVDEETDEEEEAENAGLLQLDDSSEFSEELDIDEDFPLPYPFAEKAPEVRDFIVLQKNN